MHPLMALTIPVRVCRQKWRCPVIAEFRLGTTTPGITLGMRDMKKFNLQACRIEIQSWLHTIGTFSIQAAIESLAR
jgi:hypothetical protein